MNSDGQLANSQHFPKRKKFRKLGLKKDEKQINEKERMKGLDNNNSKEKTFINQITHLT
jgi:hypothetical protein